MVLRVELVDWDGNKRFVATITDYGEGGKKTFPLNKKRKMSADNIQNVNPGFTLQVRRLQHVQSGIGGRQVPPDVRILLWRRRRRRLRRL